MYIYNIFYFSFYYSWCDVLQDFINFINVDVDVDVDHYKHLSAPTIHGEDIIEIQVPWIHPPKSINLFMSVSHTGPGF